MDTLDQKLAWTLLIKIEQALDDSVDTLDQKLAWTLLIKIEQDF